MDDVYDPYDEQELEDEDFEDAKEWSEGQCDRCSMSPGEVIEPLGICCACSIGQGAAPEDCLCGPNED
jgi:hypothetical protein